LPLSLCRHVVRCAVVAWCGDVVRRAVVTSCCVVPAAEVPFVFRVADFMQTPPVRTPRNARVQMRSHLAIAHPLTASAVAVHCAHAPLGPLHGAYVSVRACVRACVHACVRVLAGAVQELRLADAMWRYWRNFAWSGDPNMPPPWATHEPKTQALVAWPAFDNATEANLVLGTAPDSHIYPQVKDPSYTRTPTRSFLSYSLAHPPAGEERIASLLAAMRPLGSVPQRGRAGASRRPCPPAATRRALRTAQGQVPARATPLATASVSCLPPQLLPRCLAASLPLWPSIRSHAARRRSNAFDGGRGERAYDSFASERLAALSTARRRAAFDPPIAEE
jgi:hypothetical protein